MRAWRVVALLFIVGTIGSVSAQFIKFGSDKTVQFVVPTGPEFGLVVKRVAFGQPTGACGQELVDRMVMEDFQQSHIDVVERAQLDQVLAEHKFGQSGEVDPQTAVQLGKILGPSALVLVSVYNCNPEQQALFDDEKDFQGVVHRSYISKTRFALEGSVKVDDLTTGKVLSSRNFEAKQERQTTSFQGQPEYPPADVVKDDAMRLAKTQIHNMFFPGSEVRNVQFYDDKDCGLKDAYEILHRGDRDGSFKLLLNGIDGCKSSKKGKSVVRAYYDLGLEYCMQYKFEDGQKYLQMAMQDKGAEAASGTLAACNMGATGYAASQSYRDKFAALPDPQAIQLSAAPPPPPAPPSTASTTPAAPPAGGSTQNSGNATPSAKATAKKSSAERLKELNQMLKDGLITQKEYDQKKAEILKDM